MFPTLVLTRSGSKGLYLKDTVSTSNTGPPTCFSYKVRLILCTVNFATHLVQLQEIEITLTKCFSSFWQMKNKEVRNPLSDYVLALQSYAHQYSLVKRFEEFLQLAVSYERPSLKIKKALVSLKNETKA